MREFLKNIVQLFHSRNRGATIIEYCLIVSLLSVLLIGGYRLIGKRYTTLYNRITNEINGVDKTVAESGAFDKN